MRDRLIELLDEAMDKKGIYLKEIADYLLENGVIVPPCKVGDIVYAVDKRSGLWRRGKIISMYCVNKNDIHFELVFDDDEIDIYDKDSVFLTKEEAVQALKCNVPDINDGKKGGEG